MKNYFFLFSSFATLFFCSSCETLKNVQQTNIDGRQVEYTTAGSGSPTIVFETGMGKDINTWFSVFDSLSKHTAVFAYNRPGYGQSNLRNAPRNVREIAEQLHQNLKSTRQKPPYLLVGHSAGGLYVNMFARLFPEEVAGVVFLDASHPDQFEYFRKHQIVLYNILITSARKGKRRYEESIVKNTQSDFKDAPAFPDVPVLVLTAGKKSSPLETEKLRNKWLEFQADLAALSTKSKQIIVEGSGHFVHKDKPNIVIQEIIRLINY
jgi:pimeloyl-ACP methyl ester carboxylesterase